MPPVIVRDDQELLRLGDEFRQLVEEAFPDPFGEPGDDAEFRELIIETAKAGRSLDQLGREGGNQEEHLKLKELQAWLVEKELR